MSRTADDEAPSLWPEQWATHVSVEADAIEHRMRIALATEPDNEDRRATAHAIEVLGGSARRAARRRGAITRSGSRVKVYPASPWSVPDGGCRAWTWMRPFRR
jgi:hypothetical protein